MTSIVILPESNATTLCISLQDHVTAEDFDHYFHQELTRRVEENGYFNMVVCYDPNFKGWTPEAAELNLKSIFALGSKPHKLAYVNPPASKILLMKMAQPILEGELQYFKQGQYADALEWVKE